MCCSQDSLTKAAISGILFGGGSFLLERDQKPKRVIVKSGIVSLADFLSTYLMANVSYLANMKMSSYQADLVPAIMTGLIYAAGAKYVPMLSKYETNSFIKAFAMAGSSSFAANYLVDEFMPKAQTSAAPVAPVARPASTPVPVIKK